MDPQLVIFAIQAAVKLGRKIYDVLVDSTQAGPMLLPIGTLAGSIREADAVAFFDRAENQPLVADGGPYHGFSGAQLVVAYQTVAQIGDKLGEEAGTTDVVTTLSNLHRFEQHKAGFGPRSPWQRIAGTVVEIGIDYFAANPQAMGKDSRAQRVVWAFVDGLKDIDFAEGEPVDIVSNTLVAGLQVLGDNATLVSNDARIRVLLGGVTASLRDDLKAATAGSLGQVQRREDLFKRITASLVRAGAATVAGNAGLFIKGDSTATAVVRSTVAGMLDGIRDREDLFSTETLEGLFRTALTAAAANPDLFADKKLVQEVIRSTAIALTGAQGSTLFSGAAEAIVQAALQTVGGHAGTLVDPAHPERQLVADAVEAVAQGLASDMADGVPIRQLLSAAQVADLTQRVLLVVARDPQRLLGSAGGDARKTVIAQVLGSVTQSLAKDRTQLVNGDTFVELGQTALAVALKNRDKLLDLNSTDPRTNLLFKTLDAVAGAVLAGGDTRRLVDRDVFLDTARRVLTVVSADVGPVIQTEGRVAGEAVSVALQLSAGALQNQVNGDNLPVLVAGLLRAVLAKQIALNDAAATTAAATALLRAAA